MQARQAPDAGYADDAPKTKNADDALGHAPFAARLAKVIIDLAAPNGYVIGLHGPWGSGKSTVLNFLIEGIASGRQQESGTGLTIVRFEPWIVSGHQDVVSAFIKVLSEQLPRTMRRRARTFRKPLARMVNSNDGKAIDAAARLGALMDGTGGIVSGAIGGVAKAGLNEIVARWLAEPSLQSAYIELRKEVEQLNRKFLVIIDDLDRLTKEEISSLMNMVKSVGKLPNVVYLLAYDRRIVWSALDGVAPGEKGGAFAEKIVQQEIEMPMPSRSGILGMLSRGLEFVQLDGDVNSRRQELVRYGIARWIKQPRDVVRFTNAVRFASSGLGREIDPDDMLCMEGMRLYDRELFDWIASNRDLLIENGWGWLSKKAKAEMADRFEAQHNGTKANAVELMSLLFPNRTDLFTRKDRLIFEETWAHVMRRRGIATEAGYDTYFSLYSGQRSISKELVDRAVASFDEPDVLRGILEQAIGSHDERGGSLVGDLMEELRARLETGTRPTPTLLQTLLHLGNQIMAASVTGELFGGHAPYRWLITDVMGKMADDERFEQLAVAFRTRPPLFAATTIWVLLVRPLGLISAESASGRVLLPENKLRELGSILADQINQAYVGGTLDEQPGYYNIAKTWALNGSQDNTRAWISRIANLDAKHLARIADELLSRTGSSDALRYALTSKPDEDVYDVPSLTQACAKFRRHSSLDGDEAARIEALARGLDRLSQDQPLPRYVDGDQ